ncbi:MAG: hypothetical protein AAGD43_02840 [Pseudomonadota bacterium]
MSEVDPHSGRDVLIFPMNQKGQKETFATSREILFGKPKGGIHCQWRSSMDAMPSA